MATKELTVGSPLRLIIHFAFPIFLGNLFQQLYNFVDALIVGRTLGVESLAAVGSTAPYIFLVISFIFASTQGFTVITAQRFGAKDYDNVRKSLVASMILSAILMVVITLISAPFTHQLLIFLNTPEAILPQAEKYLFIMFAGIFATVFYNVSSNIIRALGDSKTPLYFLIFSSVLNVILDLIFILKFHWGVQGAGLATVVSQLVSTILCITFMFWKFPILKLEKNDLKVPENFLFEHIRVGIPMGIQMSVLATGMVIMQYVLNGFGTNAVAAFTTSMRVDQLFTQVYLALGVTMAVYTAQNFGAGLMQRIRQGARIAVALVVGMTVFSIIVISLFSENMISWFMSETNIEVMALAKEYLHIIMCFFLFLGLLMVYRNILQGMGRVVTPLMSGIAELVARGGCAILLGYYFGYTGLCYATPAAWILASIVLYIGYKINLKRNKAKLII
ncbi:MAG: MATE family efflux transporter [bacterium]|nr:MATE family efflux transporter [bacterium]